MAQSVERPTLLSSQVSLSPASGSVLTVPSLLGILSLSFLPLPRLCVCALSLSLFVALSNNLKKLKISKKALIKKNRLEEHLEMCDLEPPMTLCLVPGTSRHSLA